MACGMEILTTTVASAVTGIGRRFWECISTKIKSTVRFNRNLRDLQKEKNKLEDLKKEVEKQLESAKEDERSPTAAVKIWLGKVNEFVAEVNSVGAAATENDKSPCGCHCHCSQRFRLGSKVGRLLKEVETLLRDGNFPDGRVPVVNDPPKPVEYIPGPYMEYQTTALRNLAELTEKLEDNNVRRIGVWGLGGVGKTTLVRNLNNKLRSTSSDQRPFSIVIWIRVSKEFDLKRVQREISDRLKMEVEESIERTAPRLHQRLEKEKFLLILDDVWHNIDLDRLGIPQLETHSGSKILLTSRSADVCQQMEVDVEVKVNTLGDEEAWQLFSQKAGKMASLEYIEPTARKVARECCGLPLALVIVGTAMRGKKWVELWAHALKELRRSAPSSISGVEEKVYSPLKWSYDWLEGKTIKSCFLYCALYPEDFSIEDSELLQSWLAEGLIDDEQNFEEFFNNGVFVIETLKNACLLEDGSRVGTVKMHDVIRDVAIWIGSSTEENDSRSLVRSGIALTEIEEVNFSEDSVNRIGSTYCVAKRCSKVSTLLLHGNSIEEVPDMFLQRFPELKVMNVSRTGIKSLPPLLQLGELRAFLLQHCAYLRELSPLGVLVNLQVLNLSGTSIEELPKDMENLINLRQVNLSHTRSLTKIQAGIVSKWTRLEVLDMTSSPFPWRISAHALLASFEELLSLKHLSCVSLALRDLSGLDTEYLVNRIGRMNRFHLTNEWKIVSVYTSGRHEQRKVTLNSYPKSGWEPKSMMGWLLINATSLVWNGNKDELNDIIQGLLLSVKSVGERSFAALKSLTINNIPGYGSLPVRGNDVPDLLPNLEELSLENMTSMQSISELVDGLGLKLYNLKALQVFRCPQMKYLFSRETEMPNLELMTVSDCGELEKLSDYNLVLPNLRIMKLNRLTMLRDLCAPGKSWPCLEKVYVFECSLLTRLPLNIGNAGKIQEIRGESQWWSKLIWDDEETKSRLQQLDLYREGRSGQDREGFEIEDGSSFFRRCYTSENLENTA